MVQERTVRPLLHRHSTEPFLVSASSSEEGEGLGRMTGGTVTLLPLDVKVPCMFGSAVYV
jgi:hypothetical protein